MEDTKKRHQTENNKSTEDLEFLDEVNYSYRKQVHQNRLGASWADTTWTVDSDPSYDLTMTWGNEEVTDQEFERIRQGALKREQNRNKE